MDDLFFLEWDERQILHQDQLELFGGQDGFVDEGVVRSALARAQFTAQYNSDADLADPCNGIFLRLGHNAGILRR